MVIFKFSMNLCSASQMVSYEVSIGSIVKSVILCCGYFNLSEVIFFQSKVWYCLSLFLMFSIFFVSALAETNRHPFDLPEA